MPGHGLTCPRSNVKHSGPLGADPSRFGISLSHTNPSSVAEGRMLASPIHMGSLIVAIFLDKSVSLVCEMSISLPSNKVQHAKVSPRACYQHARLALVWSLHCKDGSRRLITYQHARPRRLSRHSSRCVNQSCTRIRRFDVPRASKARPLSTRPHRGTRRF